MSVSRSSSSIRVGVGTHFYVILGENRIVLIDLTFKSRSPEETDKDTQK